jgi:methylmalonyl-CoA/ethylmalonyl-CoA epimerase
MTADLRLDHVAIAVRSIETAADSPTWLLGYQRITGKVTNTRQRVNVLFIGREGSLPIKLIEPSDDESPLWDFVRKGGGFHHVCFKAPDVEAACAELSARGARVIAAPQPGEAFDDQLIAFVYLGLGLSAEIIDTDRRRNRIELAGEGRGNPAS